MTFESGKLLSVSFKEQGRAPGERKRLKKEEVAECEQLARLYAELQPGVLLLQDCSWKTGNYAAVRDALPGGQDRWWPLQLHREASRLVPVILYDRQLYSAGRAQPLNWLAAGGQSVRGHIGADTYAEEYSCCRLRLRVQPDCKFLAVSYHNLSQYARSPVEAERDAVGFLRAVAAAAVAQRMPALVGGDWGCALAEAALPSHPDWDVQIRAAGAFLPEEQACVRAAGQPRVDRFCLITPHNARASVLLSLRSVAARAHLVHGERYAHDPVVCEFVLAKPTLGGATSRLPHGVTPDSRVPRTELEHLPLPMLAAAALEVQGTRGTADSNGGDAGHALRAGALVAQLLREGVQYRHLSPLALQEISLGGWHAAGAAGGSQAATAAGTGASGSKTGAGSSEAVAPRRCAATAPADSARHYLRGTFGDMAQQGSGAARAVPVTAGASKPCAHWTQMAARGGSGEWAAGGAATAALLPQQPDPALQELCNALSLQATATRLRSGLLQAAFQCLMLQQLPPDALLALSAQPAAAATAPAAPVAPAAAPAAALHVSTAQAAAAATGVHHVLSASPALVAGEPSGGTPFASVPHSPMHMPESAASAEHAIDPQAAATGPSPDLSPERAPDPHEGVESDDEATSGQYDTADTADVVQSAPATANQRPHSGASSTAGSDGDHSVVTGAPQAAAEAAHVAPAVAPAPELAAAALPAAVRSGRASLLSPASPSTPRRGSVATEDGTGAGTAAGEATGAEATVQQPAVGAAAPAEMADALAANWLTSRGHLGKAASPTVPSAAARLAAMPVAGAAAVPSAPAAIPAAAGPSAPAGPAAPPALAAAAGRPAVAAAGQGPAASPQPLAAVSALVPAAAELSPAVAAAASPTARGGLPIRREDSLLSAGELCELKRDVLRLLCQQRSLLDGRSREETATRLAAGRGVSWDEARAAISASAAAKDGRKKSWWRRSLDL